MRKSKKVLALALAAALTLSAAPINPIAPMTAIAATNSDTNTSVATPTAPILGFSNVPSGSYNSSTNTITVKKGVEFTISSDQETKWEISGNLTVLPVTANNTYDTSAKITVPSDAAAGTYVLKATTQKAKDGKVAQVMVMVTVLDAAEGVDVTNSVVDYTKLNANEFVSVSTTGTPVVSVGGKVENLEIPVTVAPTHLLNKDVTVEVSGDAVKLTSERTNNGTKETVTVDGDATKSGWSNGVWKLTSVKKGSSVVSLKVGGVPVSTFYVSVSDVTASLTVNTTNIPTYVEGIDEENTGYTVAPGCLFDIAATFQKNLFTVPTMTWRITELDANGNAVGSYLDVTNDAADNKNKLLVATVEDINKTPKGYTSFINGKTYKIEVMQGGKTYKTIRLTVSGNEVSPADVQFNIPNNDAKEVYSQVEDIKNIGSENVVVVKSGYDLSKLVKVYPAYANDQITNGWTYTYTVEKLTDYDVPTISANSSTITGAGLGKVKVVLSKGSTQYIKYYYVRTVTALTTDTLKFANSAVINDLAVGTTTSNRNYYTVNGITGSMVKYTSSDESVATVSDKGIVTGKAAGKVTITATAYPNTELKITKDITVVPSTSTAAITSIKLSGAPITVNGSTYTSVLGSTATVNGAGTFLQLNKAFTPANIANQDVTWASSDESIATVDKDGKVTTLKPGYAVITAISTLDTTKTASFTVIVNSQVLSNIAKVAESRATDFAGVLSSANTVNKNVTFKLAVTANPINANIGTNYTYKSSNEEVATEDPTGVVVTKKAGVAELTVTSQETGKTGKLVITVLDKVDAYTITPSVKTLTVKAGNKSTAITAAVVPTNTKNLKAENIVDKSVTYASADETIATVDENGIVTAVKEGTTTITVASAIDSAQKATVEVTVTAADVVAEKVTLNLKTKTISRTKSFTLSATVTPTGATAESAKVTYESADETIATVDANGKVTGKNPGVTSIIAKTANGKVATCTVTVAKNVTLSTKANVSVKKGKTVTVKFKNKAAAAKVVFSTSKKSVATVTSKGVIKGVKAGKAVVTAKVTQYGRTFTLKTNVTVTK